LRACLASVTGRVWPSVAQTGIVRPRVATKGAGRCLALVAAVARDSVAIVALFVGPEIAIATDVDFAVARARDDRSFVAPVAEFVLGVDAVTTAIGDDPSGAVVLATVDIDAIAVVALFV
jgi:hypothetical protein